MAILQKTVVWFLHPAGRRLGRAGGVRAAASEPREAGVTWISPGRAPWIVMHAGGDSAVTEHSRGKWDGNGLNRSDPGLFSRGGDSQRKGLQLLSSRLKTSLKGR